MTTDRKGYDHNTCKHCGKEISPAMECVCPERQPDGSWEELEDIEEK